MGEPEKTLLREVTWTQKEKQCVFFSSVVPSFKSSDVSVATSALEEAALHSKPPQNTTAGYNAEIDRSWQSSPSRDICIPASASVKESVGASRPGCLVKVSPALTSLEQ